MNSLLPLGRTLILLGLLSWASALAQDAEPAAEPPTSLTEKPAFSAGPIPQLDGWLMSLDEGLEQSQAEGKDLLIEFAGSDWCPPCIELEEKVLSRPEFIDPAKESFVLVRLDNPRDRKSQPEELQKAVIAALRLYGVQEFPTLLLADASGRPYTRTGFRPDTPEDYLKHLIDLQEKRTERDRLLAEAEKAEGIEMAKHLSHFLSTLSLHEVKNFYSEEYRSVREADPKGTQGLGDMMFFDDKIGLEQDLNELAKLKDWPALVDRIDAFLEAEQLEGPQLQEILMFKIGPLFRQSKESEIFATLDQVIAVDAENRWGRQATNLKPTLKDALEKQRAAAEKEDSPAPGTDEETESEASAPNENEASPSDS